MSRLFNALTDNITFGTVALPTTGTLALWLYPLFPQSDPNGHTYVYVYQDDNNIFEVKWYAGELGVGWTSVATNYRVIAGSPTMSQDAWNLVLFTWDDTANLSVLYLNNAEIGSNGSLATFSTAGVSRALGSSVFQDNPTARLAEFALWTRVVTSTERGDLNTFHRAIDAAPSGLVDYLPISPTSPGDSPEPNLAGGTGGTVTGTTWAAHPPMLASGPPIYDQVGYRWRQPTGSLYAPP
jgi:hypothetical protein